MALNARTDILASKVIGYIRLRLFAEQTPSICVQFSEFENIDKMIEHMRGRLKPAFQQEYRDVYYHRFNRTQVANSNVDLISPDSKLELSKGKNL
ncbi:MAG: hypothetical protein PVG06_00430 [Desulfobacterales bacterium]